MADRMRRLHPLLRARQGFAGMGWRAVRDFAAHVHYREQPMNNVVYLHVIHRQREERRAALLRIARPSLAERIAYFFRRVFK